MRPQLGQVLVLQLAFSPHKISLGGQNIIENSDPNITLAVLDIIFGVQNIILGGQNIKYTGHGNVQGASLARLMGLIIAVMNEL